MTAEQKTEKETAEENEESSPEGTNVELRKVFFGAINDVRKKHMDDSKDFCKFATKTPPIRGQPGYTKNTR